MHTMQWDLSLSSSFTKFFLGLGILQIYRWEQGSYDQFSLLPLILIQISPNTQHKRISLEQNNLFHLKLFSSLPFLYNKKMH